MIIRPNRSAILKEAVQRSLNQGELTPGQPFKPSQERALQNFQDFLSNTTDDFERRHGYFDMATATGKTGVFSLIVRHAHRIAQEKGIGDSFKTLIVEPSVPLLRQTRKELLRIAPEMDNSIGIYGGGKKELDSPATIISYESWMSLLESNQLPGEFIDLNINDESHKGLSIRRQSLVNEVLTSAHHLGFTASSKYDTEKTMALTHRNLVYEIGLKEAIEGGMLAEYVHVQYAVMRLLPADLNKADMELTNADFTFLKRREWSRLINRAYSEMIDGINNKPLSDKIAIFFAADTRHADGLAEMLNKNPILKEKAESKGFKNVATAIHSRGLSTVTQDRLQQEFESGQYMVAVGDKKFQAGFDYPRVKMIASYPGTSIVDAVQEIGRATRPYADPKSGENQGAVIFEAIPYIGNPDPEKDEKAKLNALKDTVSARDILGNTLILKEKSNYGGYPTPKGTGSLRSPISISLGSEVQVYLTHEDTMTISSQIENARQISDENRLTITEEMQTELKALFFSRGNPGPRELIREIERYEAENNLLSTGMAEWYINLIKNRGVQTTNEAHWQRLIDVLSAMPLAQYVPQQRIQIDNEKFFLLQKTLKKLGNPKGRKIVAHINEYEAANGLASAGITHSQIYVILKREVQSMEIQQWDVLQAVLADWTNTKNLQDTIDKKNKAELAGKAPILVTNEIAQTLLEKIYEHGGYGARRLTLAIKEYEQEHELLPTRLTEKRLEKFLAGKLRRIEKSEWERITQTLSDLEELNVGKNIPITDYMRHEFQQKLKEAGSPSPEKLEIAIRKYEENTGIKTCGFRKNKIAHLLRGERKNIGKRQYDVLIASLDNLIVGAPAVSTTEKALSSDAVNAATTVSNAGIEGINPSSEEGYATDLTGLNLEETHKQPIEIIRQELKSAKKLTANKESVSDDEVFERLNQAFPLFAKRLIEKDIRSTDALISAIPINYLGSKDLFLSQLVELANTGQQYDIGRGKLKSTAQILQAVLGNYQGQAVFEDKKVLQEITSYHKGRQEFSKIVRNKATKWMSQHPKNKEEIPVKHFTAFLNSTLANGIPLTREELAIGAGKSYPRGGQTTSEHFVGT